MPNNNDILIKNKILINISGHPSLVQRKLFNVLLYLAYPKLRDTQNIEFETTISEVSVFMSYEGKLSSKRFKKDLKSLMQTVVEWDVLDEEGNINEEDFNLSTLLSSAKMSKGKITYTIPSDLRHLLIENKQYIKINLQIQKVFSSKHSISLYEVAKEFYREKDELGETPWISIQKLRKLFGLNDEEYADFKAFKRNLLGKALGEINKKTDIYLDMDLKKSSRKVSHLKFKIRKNNNLEFGKKLSVPPEKKQRRHVNESKLTKDLVSLGISEEKINDWSRDYSEKYIQSKLKLVLEKLKKGKIKSSPAGFLVRAIETNFEEKNISVSDLLEQDALEARKINPETVLVDPTSFDTKKEFEAHIEQLKGQYYEPRWLASEFESAEKAWINEKSI